MKSWPSGYLTMPAIGGGTANSEFEILTGMAATGAQIMLFSTGRGAPQGFPSMPVMKICGNPNTYERMKYDMDLNAGRIITGEMGPYGMYIKTVNGILADYDVDQTYWAFYINGEYATTGIDGTEIVADTTYGLTLTKG